MSGGLAGPAPKHLSVRARQNKASTRATLVERDPDDIEIPPLPKHYQLVNDKLTETPWHPMAVNWWNDIWPSPMSAEWHQSDIHGVYRILQLIDDFWYATNLNDRIKAGAEIRHESIPFGLEPLARRRLEWTFESVEKIKRENRRRVDKPKTTAADEPSPDDDIRLHIV